MHRWTITGSYAYCQRLAQRAAANFYHAFRLLPRRQHRAMCALYAFMRVADDLSDGPEDIEQKKQLLRWWRESLHAALAGEYHHPVYPALHHTIETYRIPVRHFEEVLDGVCMDLEVCEYDTFADLQRYCYHVAGAVGLCCIHIWGFHGPAYEPAEAAGLALQLTNILRDVAEDAGRGRIYLPAEDLRRFGYRREDLLLGTKNAAFCELMHFEADRAYAYYQTAEELLPLLDRGGRAVFQVMLRTYRGLLDAIVARNYDVFSERVRLNKWYKLWLAAGALPIRWGWW